jgi:hypothetical protein
MLRLRLMISAMVSLALLSLLGGCARPGEGRNDRRADPGTEASPHSAAPIPTPSASPGPVVPTCSGGVILTTGDGDAAMGLRVIGVSIKNCGTTPYTVKGYPQVRPLDEHHDPMAVTVLQGVDPIVHLDRFDGPAPEVTLQPGQTATFVVAWRLLVEAGDSVTVPYLEVAPMPGRPSQLVAPMSGLDIGTTGRFAITHWVFDK